ncbi:MAG: hypothetical protein NXI24_03340 [bacterium]|nr:hypothetical protein [bacterium]
MKNSSRSPPFRPRVLGRNGGDRDELGPAIIERLETLTGKSIEDVDREIRAMALRLRKNEKLRQVPNP